MNMNSINSTGHTPQEVEFELKFELKFEARKGIY